MLIGQSANAASRSRCRCAGPDRCCAGRVRGRTPTSALTITNTASVNYSVSGVPQTVISSSPTATRCPAPARQHVRGGQEIIFVAEETNGAAT